jgi:hypothetical protein
MQVERITIRRILATLFALFLIGTSPGNTNPHTVRFTVNYVEQLGSSHVFLGVAVLGNNVSRIDSGWLVKGPGLANFDWRAWGKWDGLIRTEEGPHDVSETQLHAVVHAIERLGYAPAAIRAWRVAAPVGVDGFKENDKVLTIGEILIDLGTIDQSRSALARWWDAISKDNPFEKIPLVRVAYASTYYQPDCAADEKAQRADALAQTYPLAGTIASVIGTPITLSDYGAYIPDMVLCPQNREPYFMRTGPLPSGSDPDTKITAIRGAFVDYTVNGSHAERFIAPAQDDLSLSTIQDGFELNEPYAGTIAQASLNFRPDAIVLHLIYPVGSRSDTQYDDNFRSTKASIGVLESMIQNQSDILVKSKPSAAPPVTFNIFVLVRGYNLPLLNRLRAVAPNYSDRYTPFVSNCHALRNHAVERALAASRNKAEILAHLLHVRIRNLGAARVTNLYGADPVCGFDPHESLSTLVSRLPEANNGFGDKQPLREISLYRTVNAAWTLDGIAPFATRPVRTKYEGAVRGHSSFETLAQQALSRAARQAIEDNPRIVSLYETYPTTDEREGFRWASDSLVVLR